MTTPSTPGTRHRLAWICIGSLAALTVVSVAVGFAVLPSAQADFKAGGFWDSICRAAGVPSSWGVGASGAQQPVVASNVILLPAMARPATSASVGRGATLAHSCTMCHGALGMSRSTAPNLAGQYPEVVAKQLHDYQSGKRSSAIMSSLALALSEENIADLAAYYASLPKARSAPTTYDEVLPALVRVGDPMRNIAPCISCHGGVDQKLGAPWLEGMPKDYLVQQLEQFKSGERRNDGQLQMRNVAHAMTSLEIEAVARFYARKATGGQE